VDYYVEGISLRLLGSSLLQLGRLREASERCQQAVIIQREIGDRYGEAETLHSLSQVQLRLKDLDGSQDSLSSALSIFRALGDPQADIVEAELQQLEHSDHASDI
jgi:tetratricopeptide (TPR) repeat protein